MPKMKTRRSAAKRFTLTGSGKIKRRGAFHRHQLVHKSANRRRHMLGNKLVDRSNVAQVKRMLGITAQIP
ncbi:50S ribosomal protein L35 [candidate division KSB1 bacterium]|nr:MAG: 50S ribosomal protein L35 [candidate division KSB1 bacterium]